MNSAHLYFVQSPLQVLNAHEARMTRETAAGGEGNLLVLFQKGNAYHNRLVANTLEAVGWKPWLVLPSPSKPWHKLTHWLGLRRAVRRLRDVETVWVGEYSSGMMVAAANLCRGAEFRLIDDGTSSLGFPDFRYRGVRDKRYPPRKPIPWLGFHPELPDRLTFFSIYDLPLEPPDRLEHNRLSFLGGGLRYDDRGPVLFIGSSLPDNEEMSFERFFELMAGVRRHLGDRRIIYHPHRAEHMDVKAPVFSGLNVEIVFNELPFELALARRSEPVSAVAGFYTTPLDTLRLSGAVPGERLISFFVEPSEISTPQEAEMAVACYWNYQATPGMQVVRGYAPGT